ncbi:MAG: glycosyltransferase [Candidatus Hydrogenedentota bacterium]
MFSLSVIVSTYNSPRYLELVLRGLEAQTDRSFECIIADDGSGPGTEEVVEAFRRKLNIIHSWQADEGFRLAASRNRALAIAGGDLVAFLDGDCIPSPRYVADIRETAAQACGDAKSGAYLQGHRVILDAAMSVRSLNVGEIFAPGWIFRHRAHLSNKTNALRFPFPLNRHSNLKGVRGCHMVFFAADLHAVNGFDEEFEGWGHEDRDLVRRLYRHGVDRIDLRGRAVIYHLYHPEHARDEETENLSRAMEERPVRAGRGFRNSQCPRLRRASSCRIHLTGS